MVTQFLKYAVPLALAMFVSSLYTIIDGMFIGQGVGDDALAAVNVIMPFTIMLFGIATMFAVGGGTLVSKHLGAREEDKAVNVFRQVFKFLLIISVMISGICVIFSESIASFLGATESILGLATDYLRLYALFCIPNLIGISLNSFVRNDGRPRLAMISTISGAVTNIILDYIFIFHLFLGIKGAAIATGLGQLVTVGILLPHFLCNIAIVRIIGEKGLAAFSIINYLTTNIYMVLIGICFGAQPLVSFNLGAKNTEKMIKFYHITNVACLIVNTVFTSICFIWGRGIIGIFTSNREIVDMTYIGLNLMNLGFFLTGLNLSATIYYQAIEMPLKSNLICALRSIIVFPISLFILSITIGENGIWLSLLGSELITALVMMFTSNIKKSTYKAVDVSY